MFGRWQRVGSRQASNLTASTRNPYVGGGGRASSISRGHPQQTCDTADLMARKRMLPPEMFTSATVSGWPVPTRWTWAGLSCYLDDYGYGEDSPALVKAAVWPRDTSYTERKVKADIDRIVEAGSLCRFACCDKPQIHAPAWSDWQKPSHPTPTRMCPCPVHAPDASRVHLELLPKSSGTTPPSSVQFNPSQCSSGDGFEAFQEARQRLGQSA